MIVNTLSIIVALIHIYFFILESFLYTKSLGRKIFDLTTQDANYTKIWAFNQGYYNLFLALGVIIAVFTSNKLMLEYLLMFVVMVGVVGALSVKPKIFWFQSFPAIITIIFLNL